MTEIEHAAYKENENIVSVVLPASMQKIGASAFSDCTSLSSIDLSHVSSIGRNAFNNTGINSVWLAGGTSVGSDAFNDGCVIQYADDVVSAASCISNVYRYTIYCTDGRIEGYNIYYNHSVDFARDYLNVGRRYNIYCSDGKIIDGEVIYYD